MANNMNYVRKFIILKKEYSNMRNLNPKGHGKIELRGSKLSISLNIENGEKNTYYNVILLSGIKEYELGKIYLENRTKAKERFNLNYKELQAEGFSLGNINAILILRDDKVLLGNYINKEDGSIERYLNQNIKEIKIKDQEEPDKDIEEVFEFPEEVSKEPIIDEISIIPPGKDELTQKKYEKAITNVFEPQRFIEDIPTEKKIEKIEKKDQTTDYILNILSFFPYAEPFKIDLKGYNWWKIDINNPLDEKGFLPYFSYITGHNKKYSLISDSITASELMQIHKHYIFGLYNEGEKVKFYVYGIPGKFTSKEHPEKGLTGFSTWFEGREDGGYWILYIEPNTGRIVYPINPMTPKD